VKELTFNSNWCCIVSNGSAVLGFGDIGPAAALPVMEGKSFLFNQFAGVNVVPMVME